MILLACTDGGPEPEHWELAEGEPTVEAHAGFVHQPDRARLVDPLTQPRLELVDVAERESDYQPTEYEVCPYVVRGHGFPAVSEDGEALLDAAVFHVSDSDDSDERMELTWFGATATRVELVYDRAVDRPLDGRGPGCKVAAARARERVAEINAELAAQTWRPLERLDAFFPSPGFGNEQMLQYGYEDEIIAELAANDRPIEIYYRNDHFVAKIRQLQILQKTEMPGLHRPSEFCDPDANLFAVEFDRASGAALVRYNFSNGGCLCDDQDYVTRVALSDALLAELDLRSTAPLRAAKQARLAAEGEVFE